MVFFHCKGESGWDKKEIKTQNAQNRIEYCRSPSAIDGSNHHPHQINHNEIAQLEKGIHQKSDTGSQDKIEKTHFIIRPADCFRWGQTRRYFLTFYLAFHHQNIYISAQANQLIDWAGPEHALPTGTAGLPGNNSGDLMLAGKVDNFCRDAAASQGHSLRPQFFRQPQVINRLIPHLFRLPQHPRVFDINARTIHYANCQPFL